jgi:enediyne biosynthesis protein E4
VVSKRAKEAGLGFVHFNGMSGEFYYPEIMAPGVALFDYDNVGDLDVSF